MSELNPEPRIDDSQKVELLGRSQLIDQLLRDGLEIALPIRDRGVDLVAYADLSASVTRFVARPIQMKAAWKQSFAIEKKYLRIADLLFAFVWNLGARQGAVTYAMTHAQTITVGEAMGWTKTNSWLMRGKYSTTHPGSRLLEMLEPHRVVPGTWWKLVTGASN